MQIGDEYRNTTENEFRDFQRDHRLTVNFVCVRDREKKEKVHHIFYQYTSHTVTIVLTHIFIDPIKSYLFMIIYIWYEQFYSEFFFDVITTSFSYQLHLVNNKFTSMNIW